MVSARDTSLKLLRSVVEIDSLTTSEQSQLQDKCKATVDRMTDNRHEVEDLGQYLEKIGSTPEEEEEAKKFCASQNTKRSCEGGGIHRGGVVCMWFSHREKDQCVFNSLYGDLYPGWSSDDDHRNVLGIFPTSHVGDMDVIGFLITTTSGVDSVLSNPILMRMKEPSLRLHNVRVE